MTKTPSQPKAALSKAKAPARKAKPKKAAAPKKEPLDKGMTPRMIAFAQHVASGMTYSDAYRASYNAGNMAQPTIARRASETAKRPDVSAMIGELRREATEHLVWSRGQSLQVLMEVAVDAEGVSKQSERVAAVKELNAMHGFNAPTKVDVGLRDLPPIEDESWL